MNLMFFRGTQAFTFTLPPAAQGRVKDELGFDAYRTFRDLHELHDASEPAFTYAQAIAVSGAGWVFKGASFASVTVHPDELEWILCFPVTRQGVHYALQTEDIQPEGDDVFFFFEGTNSGYTFIRAVPDLDGLKFLSPRHNSKLGLVRAKNWHWDENREIVAIRLQDVIEMEIVLDSEVRVF